MKPINIINMLNSITDVSNGSNLLYRFENNVCNDAEFKINHFFTDKRMADFYYSVLKDVPNNGIELITSTTTIVSNEPYIAYLPEVAICFNTINKGTEFRYNLKFKSTFNKIKGLQDGN